MKKRVLIIIPYLEIGGGAERVASLLTKKLTDIYEISIFTFSHFKNLYSFKGKYYSLYENLKIWQKILRPIKINKFIKSNSPDIIISFMNHTNFIMIITKLLFRIKIPLIITVRNNPNLKYQEENQYHKMIMKILYRLKAVNQIVSVSNELSEILVRDYGLERNKIITIYNGIELDKIKQLSKQEINDYKKIFNNNQLIKFVTMGRLNKQKGHKYLIEAFSKVIKEIPNARLFILGNGSSKNELKNRIEKKGLKNLIFLMGKKNPPFPYLARSDIFVLSSIFEGFPNVLTEAMACGLPIISTNCKTGPKEILENGKFGVLVNVKDSEDLAIKMISLAKNSESMKNFSKMSFQRAESFNLEKIIKDWINLIENNLGG